ncbi:uncharacterized protein LOC122009101 isoform X2 [Zingiber officinale]|uniref:uncharacterized protein LOC122009101 isoform X2 n=1 Tax=Zingiber officinale TaxID=94328 RepID=UPI001C4D68AE|nr:uncharacterized protein LOC122009101 isoform X2 [Zingiber officinale]
MGPGEAEKGVGDGKEVATCSVCLEAVTGGGGRATARLLCRHQFHLDCIGSAFNVKGVMECPNCREVEKGCWLYANGPHTPRNVRMGERIHDGELSNFHHLEMVHIQDSDYYAFTFTWMPLWFMPATPFIFFPRSITYIESGKPNTCLVSSSSKWIIDSGVTYHMRDLRTKKIIDKGYEFEGLYILDAQPFGVHWCPIGRLATIPLPFEIHGATYVTSWSFEEHQTNFTSSRSCSILLISFYVRSEYDGRWR